MSRISVLSFLRHFFIGRLLERLIQYIMFYLNVENVRVRKININNKWLMSLTTVHRIEYCKVKNNFDIRRKIIFAKTLRISCGIDVNSRINSRMQRNMLNIS